MSDIFQAVTPYGFVDIYHQLLFHLIHYGTLEQNQRTGKAIKAHSYGGCSFTIDLGNNELPVIDRRKTFPATAAAETAWYVMGTQDPEIMLKYARVTWEKFLEPAYEPPQDENQVIPLIIKAAYGYRWRKHFDRDQLALAIEALRKNPSDRRIFISAWDPSEDGLGAAGQMNVPCPVGFTFSIVNGRLNSTYLLRSSDVFVGLPYDVMGHTFLMDAVAASLGIPLGFMTFTLAYPHLYDVHFEMADRFLRTSPEYYPLMKLLGWTIEKIELFPNEYVDTVKEQAAHIASPIWCPRPEVVL